MIKKDLFRFSVLLSSALLILVNHLQPHTALADYVWGAALVFYGYVASIALKG